MDRTCRKCGHVKTGATGETAEACPECGAIYARVEMAQAKQRTEAKKVRLRRAVEEVPQQRWISPLAAKIAYGLMLAGLVTAAVLQAVRGTLTVYTVTAVFGFAVVGWIAVESVLVLFVIADHLAASRQHLAVLRAKAEDES